MAFRFKKKESATESVQRLEADRIGRALEALSGSNRLEAVHEVRKEIKRVRAILRLVRDRIGAKAYRRQNRCLRDAAGRLGGARDAHVTLQALETLLDRYGEQVAPRSFAHVRSALRDHCREVCDRLIRDKASAAVGRSLQAAAARARKTSVHAKGWPAVARGLRRSYRSGREAFRVTRADPAPEKLHEWRKRVKDLWYQVCLLRGIWREEMRKLASELKTLSDCLGDDHDLFMLEHFLSCEASGNGAKNGVSALTGLIEARRTELQRAADYLGARLYLEKPDIFCDRVHGYWRAWKNGQNHSKTSTLCCENEQTETGRD